jgi:hypothetical protein
MACHQQGATLVSITHDALQTNLEQLLAGNDQFNNTSFWIGATSFSWKWGTGKFILDRVSNKRDDGDDFRAN